MNEHTQFKIDTSGYVGGSKLHLSGRIYWSDLSPFQQGAVEAALSGGASNFHPGSDGWRAWSFSDLAPAALQRIMADCESREAKTQFCDWRDQEFAGREFWLLRQSFNLEGFPPLTISLAEDGLIHLSEVGE